MRAGQISIEYLIIIGVVVFLIVLPSAIFLSSFAQSTLFGAVSSEQANQLGEGLVSSAKQVFYLGLYAQKKISLPVPDNVNDFILLTIQDQDQAFYYIVLRIHDGSRSPPETYYFQSQAPLTSTPGAPGVSADTGGNPGYVSACDVAACSFYRFTTPATLSGVKQFSLETVNTPEGVKVRILPVVG